MQHCFLLSRKSLRFLGSTMSIAIANRKNRCDFGALRLWVLGCRSLLRLGVPWTCYRGPLGPKLHIESENEFPGLSTPEPQNHLMCHQMPFGVASDARLFWKIMVVVVFAEKKKVYTTTTERKSFGELFWPQRKTFQAGGGY